MTERPFRKTKRLFFGVALMATTFAVPQASFASPLPAQGAGESCAVSSGTLTWGLKESFRAYISGC